MRNANAPPFVTPSFLTPPPGYILPCLVLPCRMPYSVFLSQYGAVRCGAYGRREKIGSGGDPRGRLDVAGGWGGVLVIGN